MKNNCTSSADSHRSSDRLVPVSASDGEYSGLVIDTSHGAGALRANALMRLAAVKDLLSTISCVPPDSSPMPGEMQSIAQAAWILASDADDLLSATSMSEASI